MSISPSNKEKIREQIENYTKRWLWYLASCIICLFVVFTYLRYASELYRIKATIKVVGNSENQTVIEGYRRANEIDYNNYSESNEITDEIESLKSRLIMKKVVEDLNLNIQYFQQGKIRGSEIYKNHPVVINILENDSIIKNIKAEITFKVNSKSSFTFIDSTKSLNFGDKVKTKFGNIILTPNVAEINSVIGKNLSIKITPLERTLSYYNGQIKFESAGEDSNVIKISLLDPVPSKGVEIIDKLIEEYNDNIVDNKNKIVATTSDFINRRLEAVSSELSEVDLTAEIIKKDNRLTDLSYQSSIYLQSERDIENQQIETSTQLKLIDYMENYLDDNSSSGDPIPANISFNEDAINETTQQHNELVLQRNKILQNSSEINPVVINLNEQINNLKQNLRSSLDNIKSSNIIKLEALDKEDSRISSKIYSAPRKERQFRDLNRQQNIKESLYLYLLQKREESAIHNGISSPNAIVISPAFASFGPAFPNIEITILAGLIFALLIPSLVIYILELIDNKVHSKNDLKHLTTIPYLGDIPQAKSKNTIIQKVDYSPMAEAFRIVRTNVDFMLSNIVKDGKVIFISSTTNQEGKSHTSVNLAKSISFSGKRVLLIESDIRVPKANKYLKLNNKVGLTDYLVKDKLYLSEVIQKIDENLYMIPSGTIPPNPAELLMSDKMETLFKSVKKDYDYVVVDTAAIGLVTDTLIIGKYADLFIYVVRANYLDKRQLNIAETAYTEKRLPNMAILLNSVKMKKGYGYGYSSESKNMKRKWKIV